MAKNLLAILDEEIPISVSYTDDVLMLNVSCCPSEN